MNIKYPKSVNNINKPIDAMINDITFDDKLVDKIRATVKNRTMRPIKPQPAQNTARIDYWGPETRDGETHRDWVPVDHEGRLINPDPSIKCPYGVVDDLLRIPGAPDLMLQIYSIKVKRVQEITTCQAMNSGIDIPKALKTEDVIKSHLWNPRVEYKMLWNSFYRGTEYAWDENPWVWSIKFNIFVGARNGRK